MIKTNSMTRVFGDLVAVDNLELNIRQGVIHGFVGPNGAGKTTTIKMLVGLLRCTSGSGMIKGLPAGSIQARQLIGYSPERPCLYNNMTAKNYLLYMAGLSGLKKNEAEARTNELLDWLDLSKFSYKKVGGFSAGMKQRMGLAQALVHNPELLILDEPTANLDPHGRTSIINKLKELNSQQNITIFISSHILPELEKLVHSMTLIDKGKVVMEDSMEQIKQGFSQDRYVLKTSDNAKVMESIKSKPYIQEMLLDQSDIIYITCSDKSALQKDVINAVQQYNLRLFNFGEEEINLEDIYTKSVSTSGVQ
ncbi:MAG: ABC transporter ATP-binding protein [Chloroflexi bacterium]|nr:ABC transporter ATP-binding protein [Chloroflexota bacterium]MBT7079952.1 ABC transporter ATP-binding protein [Chloroflexota bacterium]MBT7290244.1 ABC transporter ATP-binding protein [Chloroflexota bacterium]